MKRILVIEGDPVLRESIGLALLKSGYQVTLAEDESMGFDTALFTKPDLIVAEILTPATTGIQFIEKIREARALANVPIVVTAAFGTGAATFSLQHGANAYEPKPVDPRTLVRTVERLLKDTNTVRAA